MPYFCIKYWHSIKVCRHREPEVFNFAQYRCVALQLLSLAMCCQELPEKYVFKMRSSILIFFGSARVRNDTVPKLPDIKIICRVFLFFFNSFICEKIKQATHVRKRPPALKQRERGRGKQLAIYQCHHLRRHSLFCLEASPLLPLFLPAPREVKESPGCVTTPAKQAGEELRPSRQTPNFASWETLERHQAATLSLHKASTEAARDRKAPVTPQRPSSLISVQSAVMKFGANGLFSTCVLPPMC